MDYMDRLTNCPDCGKERWAGTMPHKCEEKMIKSQLSFNTLRKANYDRQQLWNTKNELTLAYRGNELAGEVGEACNVIKKLERERLGIKGSRDTIEHLTQELADVIICVDLICMSLNINLAEAVKEKFNMTSNKMGFDVKL